MDKKWLLYTSLEEAISNKDNDELKTILNKIINEKDDIYNYLYKIIDDPEIDENLANILLTSIKININQTLNLEDHTLLHCLAYHGHLKILQNIFNIYEDVKVDCKCKEGRTPFMFAAKKNHIEVLEVLKIKNANINHQDNRGWSALHFASCAGYQGRLPAVKKLIELGVKPDIKNVLGETALMKAAQKGLREIVALLLQSGANANIKCKQDNTALDYAARKWYVDCIKLLIEKTDNLDGKDRQGKTILINAAKVSDVELISYLLARGVNVNEKCSKGFSALNYAVIRGHLDCIKLLITNNANAYCKDAHGQTILMKAAGFGQDGILQYLIDSFPQIDINDICSDSRSALDYAAWGGHIKCVKILVTHGADIETKDVNGQTPLIKAAGFGHVETVEYLLKSGAQIENQCNKRRTALNYASYNGKLECVKILINYNADIHTRDIEKQTPLSKAAGFGNAELVQYLISLGAAANTIGQQTSALGFAARNGSLECVKLLVENGADIKFKSADGFTPLIEASVQGNLDILNYLLSYDIDIDETCNSGRTALINASFFGHLSCVKALLQNGAKINYCDFEGETCLFKAISKNHCSVIVHLLENGANVQLVSKEGRYPLIEAAYRGCFKCVSALVAKGAEVNFSNFSCIKFHETALVTAMKFNFGDIVAFLLENGADIYQNNNHGWTALDLAKNRYPRMLPIIRKYRRII